MSVRTNLANRAKLGLFMSLTVASLLTSPVYADGIGSSGGGNSIGRRMVDLTAVTPEDLAEFDTHIAPAIDRAKRLIPEFGDKMDERLHQLSFKIVPRRLEKVPSSETGIPFETDQVGIQRRGGEVWIDELYYSGLDEKNKAGLIVHETVLALLNRAHPDQEDYAAVRNITSILLQGREPNAAALKRVDDQLSSRGFGFFTTALDLKDAEELKREYAQRHAEACKDAEIHFAAQLSNLEIEIYANYNILNRYRFSSYWQQALKKDPAYLVAAELMKNGKLIWSCQDFVSKNIPLQAISSVMDKSIQDSPTFQTVRQVEDLGLGASAAR